MKGGLSPGARDQRRLLFGTNEIDIKAKPISQLLVDEVSRCQYCSCPSLIRKQIIHPFYVFQIASIVLWCLDDYYYYAFCIAVISGFSITTTLVETRKVGLIALLISEISLDIT